MRRLLTIALAGTALLAAGCGSDDDEDTAGPTPTSSASTSTAERPPSAGGGPEVAEYRDTLRGQCEEIAEQVEGLEEPTAETPEALADYFDGLQDLSREQQREFEAVAPPEQFADGHENAVELGDDLLGLTDEFIADLRGGEDPAALLRELTPQIRDAAERSNAFYEQIGVPACQVDPTTGTIGGASS